MSKVVLLAALAACGGSASDFDPGAGEDPGTGTSTLAVNGDATARPRIPNATTADDFDTHMSIRVRLNNADVTTGTVTLTSARGTTTLTYRGEDNEWDATIPGYDEVYVLDVISGDDRVEGVRVDGPDIHTFSAPLAGATVDSTQPLLITWEAEDEAAVATIDAEELDRLTIPDTRTYSLAAGALKADSDEPRENTIELERTNRVSPAGAVAGSELRVSVENSITVVAAPDPNR